MLVPFLLQGVSVQTGAFQAAIRFFLSGDLYYYAFVSARPEMFFNYYDWSSYLLHPFLVLVGQRAYEYPLGALLLGHFLGFATVSGPNPHANVLGLVLFNGNIFLAALFCVVLGIATTLMRYSALRVFFWDRLPPVMRSLISVTLSFNAPILFLDFGTAERYVLAYGVVGVVILAVAAIAEMAKKGPSRSSAPA